MEKIKHLIPHIIALVLFTVITAVYMSPQLEGKILRQGDIISYKGMANEAIQYKKETGEDALWTNSMFGGMPTYQIRSPQKNNFIIKVGRVLKLGFSNPIGIFIMGMICFYICLLLLGVGPWASIVCAISFGLCTVNMINYDAGHTSKVAVIMSIAPMLAGMVLVMRKRYLIGAAVFSFFFALALSANHVQMIYYVGLFCGIYMIAKLVESIRAGEVVDYAKGAAILVICSIVALGTFSAKLLVTNEYAKDTMRGKPILESTGGEVTSSSETDGLEWNYAMQYSHNYLDALAAIVPRAAGGSSAEMIDKDTNFAKAVRSRTDARAPLYFGGLPPTAGAYYLGAVLFLLFLVGAVLVRGPMKWWLILTLVFSILLSMGKYAAWLNYPLFEYLPYFNKFRAPNSVIAVTSLFVPLLAGLGLQSLLTYEDKSELLQNLKIPVLTLCGFLLGFSLLGPFLINLDGPSDGKYAQYPAMVDALMKDRASLMRMSGFRSLLFVLMSSAAIYLFAKDKINKYVLLALLGVLSIFDIGAISKRYFNEDSFMTKRAYNANFEPRSVDTQILQDTDPHYRVHDITTNPWVSSAASYHHKTIGGYNAAKLQRIQDIIDRYLDNNSPQVLNMLNAKYFIVPGNDGKPVVQRNPAAIGNAWYVANVQQVNTANEEIDAIANLDPRLTAVVNNEFSDKIKSNLSTNGSITLTSYSPNKITYRATGTGDRLAVFSEVWYGPNKGWQAYIDGSPIDHIRTNYLLRGLMIPDGDHDIAFEFSPSLYKTGEMISLISSLLILALGAFAVFMFFKNRKSIA